ncbi:MAG: PAS domain S-box protein [Leptolyngbyaceae cyanobacterium HOT.MB2.61]|nr:PAS domain S-box protein [Leptolyngbyaceae cyanobacterium HOT.MB2.61]
MDTAPVDPAHSFQATLSKMEIALEAIADAIVWTDAQQRIEWYNPAFNRLVNHPSTSLIGASLIDVLPLTQAGQGVAATAYPDARVRQGEHPTTEYEYGQGEQSRLLEIAATCVESEDGQSVVLVLRDITQARRVAAEHQRVEQEQEQTLSLLKATLESTADGILVVTHDRNTPIYNQKFLQMWGLPETLMQPGYANERLQVLADQTKDPEGFTARVWELFRDRPEETALELLEFKDGRIFERYSQPLRKGNEIIGRVWSFRDIGERQRNEQALQQQAIAIKTSIDGIAILDANETYLYLNESHARIYGYGSPQELIGKNWQTLYDEAELLRFEQEIFPEFYRTGHWQGEAMGVRRDGRRFPQEVSLSATQNGGFVWVVRDISSRKQAEAALREAEERYRSIFENAVVGIYQTAPDGRYLSVNPTLARMHGYESPAEMVQALTDIAQQLYVNRDRWEEFKQLLTENETITDFEAQVYRKDGSIIWVSENARTVRDRDGNVLYYEGSSIDITERKQAEQSLRNSEERLRLALEAGRMGIWDWNILTGEVKWSDNLEEVHGMERGRFGGTFAEFLQIIHPQDREWVSQEIARAVETGEKYDIEFRILWADGSIHWIAGKGQTFRNSSGNPIRMIGTGMDVTDRKQAEAGLRQSEARFRMLYEATGLAVMLLDESGFFDCNQAAVDLLGYPRQDIIGKFPSEISPPLQMDGQDSASLARQLIDITLEHGSNRFEWTHRRPNGSELPVEVCLTRIEGGSTVEPSLRDRVFIQAILQDLTERKQVEAALAEQASLEAFRADVDNALAQSDTMPIMLQRCAAAVVVHLNAAFARIWTLNPEENVLELKASAGMYTRLDGSYSRIPVGSLKIGAIAQNHQPFITNTVQDNSGLFNQEWARQEGLVSFAGYPLMLGDQFLGVIAMFSRKPITESIAEALGFAASEIALGIGRKRAEAALRESEIKFRTIVENANDVIFALTPEGEISYISPNVFYIHGYAPSELEGKPFADYVHPDDLPQNMEALNQAIATGKNQSGIEYRSRHKEGHWLWQIANISVSQDQDGRPLIVGVARDITERKYAEERLQESFNLLNGVINGTNDFIFVKNLQGQYILVNREFTEAFGRPNEEIIGLDDFAIFPAEAAQQILDIDANVYAGGTFRTFEEKIPIHGTLRTFLTTKTPYRDVQGNIIGLIGIARDISDRKQAEEALRRSELKYRNIFENSHVGIGRTRLEDGLFLEVNQRYAEIMGFSAPSDLVGRRFTREFYANPEDRDRLLKALEAEGEVRSFEEKLLRPDGTIAWGLLSLRLNREENCIEFVIADISDRKRLEEELRQSQQFLDSIINNIPLALFTKDIRNDFRYVLINQNSDRILGFSREGAIGKNDYDMLPKELADIYRKQDETAISLGTVYEIPEYLIKSGDRTILARSLKLPLFDSNGNPTYLLCISEDITERKRQEDALRLIVEGTASKTGEEFFRSCVRYLAEVLQVHCAFVTEWANEKRTKARILAIWMGGEFRNNFEIDLYGTPCEHVVADKQVYFYPKDVPVHFPNDPYLHVLKAESYLGIPLLGSSDNLLGYLAVTDTKPMHPDPGRELILKIFAARAGAELERQHAETALMIAKEAAEAANRAKSTFLANMSHELRTPLNSILGFTQLMVRDSTLASQQRNFLETINRSGEHLLTLINDVLEMSKIEAGKTVLKPEPFDLHLLLQTVYGMFQTRAENKQLSLEFSLAPDLPQHIVTDEGKLRQVLINLLSNAIKFTQTGGVVLRVEWGNCRDEEDGKLQAQSLPLSPLPLSSFILHFEVEDSGIGIAPNELIDLFQPFVQTTSSSQHREGTGLGLAISRQFVQLMGGSIGVTSTLGQGSTFSFNIPVPLADPAEILPSSHHGRVIGLAPNQPTYRILVVDDRPENRDLIAQLLLAVGFEVQTANHGREAIAQWQTWHPHLIWMDMRMPVMDGYEATRRIRDIESRALLCVQNTTKIIALTASAFDEQQSTILAAGCDDLVIKPFREEVVFEKMATHLGVQYIYAEEPAPPNPPSLQKTSDAETSPLPSLHLLSMPSEWIAQLHQAALAVDADQILQLIEQIPESDRALAEALKDLVQRFNFDEILELTQQEPDRSVVS